MAFIRLAVIFLLVLAVAALIIMLIHKSYRLREATQVKTVKRLTVSEAYDTLMRIRSNSRLDVAEALAGYKAFIETVQILVPAQVETYLLKATVLTSEISTMFTEKRIIDERKALIYFTLTDYIPTTIYSYVKLPVSQRSVNAEATKMVVAQLDSIIVALQKVQDAEVKDLKSTIEASALFLKQKFSE